MAGIGGAARLRAMPSTDDQMNGLVTMARASCPGESGRGEAKRDSAVTAITFSSGIIVAMATAHRVVPWRP